MFVPVLNQESDFEFVIVKMEVFFWRAVCKEKNEDMRSSFLLV